MPVIFRNPSKFLAYSRLAHDYRKSVHLRQAEHLAGLTVPPFLILSITAACNLKCAGCYAAAVGTTLQGEARCEGPERNLDFDQWQHIIQQARDLGVFGFILAGGEPFLFPRLLDLCAAFPDRLFLIFTNGTALNDDLFSRLKRLPNAVVIVSIEGDRLATDQRRGTGVYLKAIQAIERLHDANLLGGISVTITRNNYEYWMESTSIDALQAVGVRLGFFIEYIPAGDAPKGMPMLSSAERDAFRARILEYRASKAVYIIHSPGDEKILGGCISAGRGFAHVTPRGDLTPCPVSLVATHNLATSSLREGLESPLFQQIRESECLLDTGDTPCALFAHPEQITSLARNVGGYQASR
jgi:MoaA/NifB/PqqE/SkfB family radical SAM enzyme